MKPKPFASLNHFTLPLAIVPLLCRESDVRARSPGFLNLPQPQCGCTGTFSGTPCGTSWSTCGEVNPRRAPQILLNIASSVNEKGIGYDPVAFLFLSG